jgi:phage FluMu protein Com
MNDVKIIIRCNICEQQLRIPASKHIRFKCPHCHTVHEYNNGMTMADWTEAEGHSSTHVKPTLQWRKSNFLVVASAIFAGILVGVISSGDNSENDRYYASSQKAGFYAGQDLTNEFSDDDEGYTGEDALKDMLDLTSDIAEEVIESEREKQQFGNYSRAYEEKTYGTNHYPPTGSYNVSRYEPLARPQRSTPKVCGCGF